MPISTEINKETNLRIHKVTGELKKELLIEQLKQVYSAPDFDPDMNVLWDLSDAMISSFTGSNALN